MSEESIKMLIYCVIGLVVFGLIMGTITARQIRRTIQMIREDEARISKEISEELNHDNNDITGPEH